MASSNGRAPDKPTKRYKTFLDPNYKQHWVSQRSHAAWIARATQADNVPHENSAPATQDTSDYSEDETARQDAHSKASNDEQNSSMSIDGDSVIGSVGEDESSMDEEDADFNRNEPNWHRLLRPDIENDLNDDHSVMFEASALSVSDVMQMIVAYSVRFCLSYEARKELVDMIRCLAGPTYETWNMTKYQIKQRYDPPANVVNYTFFCEMCKAPLLGPVTKNEFENKSVTCDKCQLSQQLTMQSGNRFIYIDLEYQFKQLLSSRPIYQRLIDNLAVRDDALDEECRSTIRDVYDSQLYRAVMTKYARTSDCVTLTYNFNTDGMPIFNSSKKSSWPLLLILNELPPDLRFKHVLLAGLWVGNKEPTPTMMNTFLNQFVVKANCLLERGLTITSHAQVETTFKFAPLCCIVDSVARPILQNRLQYNGYHGCSWCYAYGKYTRGAVRYFFEEVNAELRTHESHKNDIEQGSELNKCVNGVKGESILLLLLFFDIVWGFPLEYMHAILLGVIKLLWEIWTTFGSPVHLTATQRAEINRRLMQMTPIYEIKRLPRPLSEKAKWKASEWLSWLLFYSLPCLSGILPDAAFEHLSLLVDSVFILLQQEISIEQLNQCELNLVKFVGEFEILYGKENVTFNVHSLLHVVKSVQMSGPLWASSAFCFESTNYHLKQQVNGPKGVDDQISIRYLERNLCLWKLWENPENSQLSTSYCKKLFHRPESVNCTRTTDNVVLLGNGMTNDNLEVCYQRCIFRSTPFHSARYKPNKRTNDSMVLLVTNEIARILAFVYIGGRCYVDIQKIRHRGTFHASHIFKVRHCTDIASQRISINEIAEKLMIVEIDEVMYVSKTPRNFE